VTRTSALKNLGPACERWLRDVGIETAEQLAEVGSVEAYLRVKERLPHKASLVLLYALEGALLDIHWNALPPEVKAEIVSAPRHRLHRRWRAIRGRVGDGLNRA
jgi:DNA transformation protein